MTHSSLLAMESTEEGLDGGWEGPAKPPGFPEPVLTSGSQLAEGVVL